MLSSTLLLVRLLAFANGIFSVTTSEVEHQTLSLGEWTPIAPIATYERQEFTTVTLNTTNIYMIGGVIPLSSTGDPFPTVTYMQTYSLPKDEWTSVAPVPVALNHPNAAVVEGKIYLLGGLTPGEPATWVASSACFVYDPVGDEWTSLGDMPDGRGSAAVGVREKTIYLAGGLTFTGLDAADREDTVSNVSSYNTATEKWDTLPSLPVPRDHAGVALIEDTLYVLGGRAFGHDNVVNTVFALNVCDPKSVWKTDLATMPTARGGCASGVLKGVVYTFGGEGDFSNAAGVFNSTEAYDPKTDRWTKLAPMAFPRHGSYAAVVEDRIYLAGGGTVKGGAPTNYSDYFTL